jgi:hypothetical protein
MPHMDFAVAPTLQSEIVTALQQLKTSVRPDVPEADVRVELLDTLRHRLAEKDNVEAAQLVESVRLNGLRVAADTEPGDPTVSVDLGSLTRMVEAIAALKAAVATSRAHPAAAPVPAADRLQPMSSVSMPSRGGPTSHELAKVSREAEGRVRALLESEADPNRQWQRVVALIGEDAGHPPRDLEIDLSDNSFLYSR